MEYAATSSGDPGNVESHLKDSSNNTFIGIRVVNNTHDLAYFEFTDAVKDWNFQAPDFCELYDLKVDPHQLHNICKTSPMAHQLHAQLYSLYNCKGAGCN